MSDSTKIINDRTPIQYQAEQVSEKLTGVMVLIGVNQINLNFNLE